MRYTFVTPDHPEAQGRQAIEGEIGYAVYYATDDGGRVTVRMGREAFLTAAAFLLAMLTDEPELGVEAAKRARNIENTPEEEVP